MNNTAHIAATGLQQAESRLDATANRMASGRAEPVMAAVDQILALRDAQAQADVVDTVDDMAGTLLDLFA